MDDSVNNYQNNGSMPSANIQQSSLNQNSSAIETTTVQIMQKQIYDNEPDLMEIQQVIDGSINYLEQNQNGTQYQNNQANYQNGQAEQSRAEIQETQIISNQYTHQDQQNLAENQNVQTGLNEQNMAEIQETQIAPNQYAHQVNQNLAEDQNISPGLNEQNRAEIQQTQIASNQYAHQYNKNRAEDQNISSIRKKLKTTDQQILVQAEQMEIEQIVNNCIDQTQQHCNNSLPDKGGEIDNVISQGEFWYPLSEFQKDFDDKNDDDAIQQKCKAKFKRKEFIFEKFSQLEGDEIMEQMLTWRCRRGRDDPFIETISSGDLVEWHRNKKFEYVPIKISQIQKNQRLIFGQNRYTGEKFENGIPLYELRPAYPCDPNLLDFYTNYRENQYVDWFDKEKGVWYQGKIIECEKNEDQSVQIVEADFEVNVQGFVETTDEIQRITIQLYDGQFIDVKGDEIGQVLRPALTRVQGKWGPFSTKILELHQEIKKKIIEGVGY